MPIFKHVNTVTVNLVEKVLTSNLPFLGPAPQGAVIGIQTGVNPNKYWRSVAGVWTKIPDEVLHGNSAPTGTPPVDAVYFIDDTSNIVYQNHGNSWILVPDEYLENAGIFVGAAPAGAVIGKDTTNGNLYEVIGGNWSIISTGGAEISINSGNFSGVTTVESSDFLALEIPSIPFSIYAGDCGLTEIVDQSIDGILIKIKPEFESGISWTEI